MTGSFADACTIESGTITAITLKRAERSPHDEGIHVKTTTKHTLSARMLAVLACLLLLAGIAAGCKPAAQDDKKLMLEAVAKWYTAQGALDIAGFKAGIYDPTDILGVATMTAAPEGAVKSEVQWAWAGETIVVTVPSEQSTVTLSVSPDQTNVVLLKDALGEAGTFIMKKVDGTWKIDIAETQKISAAQSATPTSTPATKAP